MNREKSEPSSSNSRLLKYLGVGAAVSLSFFAGRFSAEKPQPYKPEAIASAKPNGQKKTTGCDKVRSVLEETQRLLDECRSDLDKIQTEKPDYEKDTSAKTVPSFQNPQACLNVSHRKEIQMRGDLCERFYTFADSYKNILSQSCDRETISVIQGAANSEFMNCLAITKIYDDSSYDLRGDERIDYFAELAIRMKEEYGGNPNVIGSWVRSDCKKTDETPE